jgi:hypothetical protein
MRRIDARSPVLVGVLLGLAAVLAAAAWWLHPGAPAPLPAVAELPVEVRDRPLVFDSRPIGRIWDERPWITHATVVDLDGDGWLDVVACDGQLHQVVWVRQTAPGQFEESIIARDLPGPARVEPFDFTGNGHLDLLVASMGVIFPNNEKIGSVVILENDGHQRFTPRVVLAETERVTDVRAADLDGDGRPDLVVGQFGYHQGAIRWLRNEGDGRFAPHDLLLLSGTIHVPVADVTGNGHPDIVACVSQEWEEIYLFENQGGGRFVPRVLWGSTNEDYGMSGLVLADLNGSGRLDIVFTNGDGFDYAKPGSRAWHGVQWLENVGDGSWRFHRVGDLHGAYSPCVVDLDGDGHLDIVAVSTFNEWDRPTAVSLVWFRNNGRPHFTRHVLATQPTHLLVVEAADLTGDGRLELITAGFHAYPPYDRMSRLLLWSQR